MKVGSNKHGNQNEKSLVSALNGKKVDELTLNLKEFIKYICKHEKVDISNSEVVYAKEETNNKLKQDLYIIINNIQFGISLKMGSGNSVHQEKCSDFINYIKLELGANDAVCEAFKLLIWADGTIDGSGALEKDIDGNIIARYTSKQFRKLYPTQALLIQKFLDDNAYVLINRFLFIGRHGSVVNFIYHGTTTTGTWVSTNEIIDFQIKNKKKAQALTIGRMSIQPWNACIKGKNEHKRGQLQVKYGAMEKDLGILMISSIDNIGTFSGDREEHTFCRMLNKNKNHNYWKIILPSVVGYEDYYAVVVDGLVESSLSGKKVYTKTDLYVINKKISKEFILLRQYLLIETDIAECHHYCVPNSGISIKMTSSIHYTLQKLTKESFLKAVSSYHKSGNLILIGLLLYSKESEIHKNSSILYDFNISEELFIELINNQFQTSFITLDSECTNNIRKLCQDTLVSIIESNSALKTAIFTGYGWFNAPYYITFIFKNGELTNNIYTDYYITTGSGRSKGKYSIEIKPK